MTREEAKELLLHIFMTYEPKDQYGDYDDPEPYEQALTMAIEALSEDISEDGTLKVKVKDGSKVNRVLVWGDNIFGGLYYPEVVRCKDCRHWNSETNGCKRNPSVEAWYETDFCKYGERREP